MMTSSWHQRNILMQSHSWSLVVTRGHSWSLVVTRGHSWSLVVYSWSLVVIRGHSCSLVVTRVYFKTRSRKSTVLFLTLIISGLSTINKFMQSIKAAWCFKMAACLVESNEETSSKTSAQSIFSYQFYTVNSLLADSSLLRTPRYNGQQLKSRRIRNYWKQLPLLSFSL